MCDSVYEGNKLCKSRTQVGVIESAVSNWDWVKGPGPGFTTCFCLLRLWGLSLVPSPNALLLTCRSGPSTQVPWLHPFVSCGSCDHMAFVCGNFSFGWSPWPPYFLGLCGFSIRVPPSPAPARPRRLWQTGRGLTRTAIELQVPHTLLLKVSFIQKKC